ncbi:hypothetical protein UT300013_04530 [Paraclostridium sordellii]
MDKRLETIAKKLGIESIVNKSTFEVSGGQTQRAAIVRAIIKKPSILLTDEPTGNLDSKATNNMTTLMVTHEPYTASFCNRIIFIKDGKVCKELFKDSNREEFYKEILEVVSQIGGTR